MKAFGIEKMDDDLLAKIRTCLEIMESRLPDATGIISQKKRKKPEETMPPPPLPPPPDPTPPPAKKRRGRPPKVQHELIIKQEEPAPGASHNSDSESTRDDALPRSVVSSVASVARPRRSLSNGNKSTLSAIVARFEQQHREMGEMYRQMGETLAALKSKIEESRESTEREIRSELLQEVQKTIMSSFPKK
jgi:hypothetical protein